MRRRGGLLGPILLTGLGVLFLVRNFRPEIQVWELLGKYWPVLLIVLGLAKLIQALTPADPDAPPRPVLTGGEVFLLIFIALVGFGIHRGGVIQIGEIPWFFDKYNYTEEAKQAVSEKTPSVTVINPRGEVRVVGTDSPEIQVKAEKEVRTRNESAAREMNESTKLEIAREGSLYVIRTNADRLAGRSGSVTSNLEIHLPKGAVLDIQSKRGDVNVNEVAGPLALNVERGDVSLADVGGNVRADVRRGSFTAQRIKGNVEMDGRGNDLQVTDVDGEVVVRGEYTTIGFAGVKKVLHMTSTRTDLQIQKLPGKVDMTMGSLSITEPSGPVSVTTRAKDIHIEDFDGPVQITDRDASIDLSTKKMPVQNIEVENKSGRIEVALPSASHFQVDATARRGEVNTEFSELSTQKNNEQGTIKGTVGKNGSTIKLNTTYGTISLRKQG